MSTVVRSSSRPKLSRHIRLTFDRVRRRHVLLGPESVTVLNPTGWPAESDRLAGAPSFDRKSKAAQLVKELGWPLTLNVVLHRQNIDHVAGILRLAEELQADRVELANTQYYGWAWRNRSALLPSRSQLERAEVAVRTAHERLAGQMDVIYVLPDYYSRYPKPCMDGWGRRQLTVAPNGDVLPCPAAQALPLPRASVHEDSLARIWEESTLFQRFRGTDWMPDPCRSCDRRELDFGGCRCQAFQLTGAAARTDPFCHLSPDHGMWPKPCRLPTSRRRHVKHYSFPDHIRAARRKQ